jgi:ketosteroid isomerase-like protein
MSQLGEKLRAILEAFDRGNADHALALIDAAYGDDIEFRDPLQHIRGKRAFMAMNRRFFGAGQEMRVAIESIVGDEREAFVAYTMRYAPRMGPTLTLEAASHCRAENGTIVYHRDYWDLLGSVMGSLPGVSTIYRALVARLG